MTKILLIVRQLIRETFVHGGQPLSSSSKPPTTTPETEENGFNMIIYRTANDMTRRNVVITELPETPDTSGEDGTVHSKA